MLDKALVLSPLMARVKTELRGHSGPRLDSLMGLSCCVLREGIRESKPHFLSTIHTYCEWWVRPLHDLNPVRAWVLSTIGALGTG